MVYVSPSAAGGKCPGNLVGLQTFAITTVSSTESLEGLTVNHEPEDRRSVRGRHTRAGEWEDFGRHFLGFGKFGNFKKRCEDEQRGVLPFLN